MKKIALFLFVVIIHLTSTAQRSEIGALAGTSFYIGDLNPTTLFANPKVCGGILYRYNFSPRWALKANIVFAEVEASDKQNNNNYERNLSFRSPITEISVQGELNFFRLFNEHGRNCFSPYIFAGLALFSFNPQAELNGKYYDLQCIGTEGQGLPGQKKPYSLVSVAIPFGIGIKVNAGKYISFGLEWGMRYTFTDYLDDVGGVYYNNDILLEKRGSIIAQLADRSEEKHIAGTARGNSTTNDLYSFAAITFTFKVGNEQTFCQLKYKARPKIKLGRKN